MGSRPFPAVTGDYRRQAAYAAYLLILVFVDSFTEALKNPGGSEPTGASRRSGRLSLQAVRTGYPERLISSARHDRIQSNPRRPAPLAAKVRSGAHRVRTSRPGSRLMRRWPQKARVLLQSTSWDTKYSGANCDVNIFLILNTYEILRRTFQYDYHDG